MKSRSKAYRNGSYHRQTYLFLNHSLATSTKWMMNYFRVLCRLFPPVLQAKDKQILEIGSGRGSFINLLNQSGFRCVTASDLNNILYPSIQNNFLKIDITKFTATKKFDLIFSFDVMEHILQTEAAILCLKKALTPQGTYIFSTPYPTNSHISDPYHINMQYPSFYTNLFYQHGFRLIKITTVSFLPYLWRFGLYLSLPFVINHRLFINQTFFVFQKSHL